MPVKPAASSREVMGRERSRVMLLRPSKEAALEVVRLFTQRGFLLVEHRSDDRGITLRFKGDRTIVREPDPDLADTLVTVGDAFDAYLHAKKGEPAHHHHYRRSNFVNVKIGSVFYVRVEPRGDTATSITAIGRPMRNGREACTPDPEIHWPCEPIRATEALYAPYAGVAEAELVEGVFAELWLSGNVISPDPAILRVRHAAELARQHCLNRQRELHALAGRVRDPRARAQILGAVPECLAEPELLGEAPPAR